MRMLMLVAKEVKFHFWLLMSKAEHGKEKQLNNLQICLDFRCLFSVVNKMQDKREKNSKTN